MEEPGEGRSGSWIGVAPLRRKRNPRCALLLSAACLSLLAGLHSPARADTDLGPLRTSGEGIFGFRPVAGDWGSSKFDEYRDLRPGLLGGGWFLLEDKDRRYFLGGDADYVGRLDQHYDLSSGRYNRFKVETYFNQFPHNFSNDAASIYTNVGSGIFLLPDSLQADIQAAPTTAAKSRLLGNALQGSTHVDLDFTYRETGVRMILQPLPELELSAGYRLQERVGTRPRGMAFGSPGSNFANIAAPIDERIHELTAGIGYNRDDWNLQLNYVGSWFKNDLESIVVDNPLRVRNSAFNPVTGASTPAQARDSLAPDNSAHTLSLTGTWKLPVEFPARITGTVATSRRFQDQSFLPQTINTAFTSPLLALPRNSLDGEVRTWLGNVRLTARPTNKLNITGSYRLYDLNNLTPVFAYPAHVLNDSSLVIEDRMTAPNSYRVQNADLETSYRLFENKAKAKMGFEWERWNRDDHREVRRLDEFTGKAGFDLKISDWASMRTGYRFGVRRGSDYNTFAHIMHTVVDTDEAALAQTQSTLLRKYDEADRNRHKVDVDLDLDPRSDLTVGWNLSYTDDNYVHSPLGLTGYHGWTFGGDAEYRPTRWLTLTPFFTYERYQYDQSSRWRPVTGTTTFNSPLNDWQSTTIDRVFTVGAGAKFDLIEDKLDLEVNYLLEHATGETPSTAVFGQVPATGANGGNAVNWPDLRDVYNVMNATLNYHMPNDLTLHLGYSYEQFDMQDFKINDLFPFMAMSNVNGSGIVSPSTDIFLGNRIGNYSAHIMMFTASYGF